MALSIAFVDDSRSILKTIEVLLRQKTQSGLISIETFSKPLEFLENVASRLRPFDCVFLDINMPAYSGYDVIRHLRELNAYKNTPVIAVTTENSQEAQAKGKEYGFDDWLIKINAPTTFLKSINAILEKHFPAYDSAKSTSVTQQAQKVVQDDPVSELNRLFTIVEELNKKLIIAEENKSRFLSLIYNEFNNPLLSVTMLMKDIIDDREKSKEDIIESIEMIYADILTLNNQLSNILAAAEIESTSRMEKIATYFDMNSLISDIVSTQQSIYRDKEIEADLELLFNDVIYNDRDKLHLILRNLIENAFEFSPEKCTIFINGFIESKNIVFVIKNLGNKIAEQARIYDAFYQERSDFSRIHHGLGLGLAVVKHYANFLGGLVLYTTDNEYNVFRVSLPLKVDINQNDADVAGMTFDDDSDGEVAQF